MFENERGRSFFFFFFRSQRSRKREKKGSTSRLYVAIFVVVSTPHTHYLELCELWTRKGACERQKLGRRKAFPLLFFFHQAKKKRKKLLTLRTSCSNVDSSTSSTALTARPDSEEREAVCLRAAVGKAGRCEGRARPNAAVEVLAAAADADEHRAEDSDAEVVLEEGLAVVAARPVAVAFIDASMVACDVASFLRNWQAEERLPGRRGSESEAKESTDAKKAKN